MPSILLINPNTSTLTLDMMLTVARPLLPTGVALQGAVAAAGAAMILDEAALAAAEEEVVRIGTAAARDVDVIVVAAFGDPGVRRLRNLLGIPVVGIGEAAIREAAAGGWRFGIATTTPRLVRSISAGVCRLGLQGCYTGARVPDCDPLELAADPAKQDLALAQAALDCMTLDGAGAVIIGGGPLSETAARLRCRSNIPIVEPIPSAMRAALNWLRFQKRAGGNTFQVGQRTQSALAVVKGLPWSDTETSANLHNVR